MDELCNFAIGISFHDTHTPTYQDCESNKIEKEKFSMLVSRISKA